MLASNLQLLAKKWLDTENFVYFDRQMLFAHHFQYYNSNLDKIWKLKNPNGVNLWRCLCSCNCHGISWHHVVMFNWKYRWSKCDKYHVNRMNCIESRGEGSDWPPPPPIPSLKCSCNCIFCSKLLGLLLVFISSNELRNGRSACDVSIQTASGPLLVISIGLRNLFSGAGDLNFS